MKKFLLLFSFPLLGLTLLALQHRPSSANIHLIKAGVSNVYLLQGEQNILIDTGPPKKGADIEKALSKLGVNAADLRLIILTHGHGDHAGATAYFQEKHKIPVLAAKGDEDMMAAGKNRKLSPISAWGKLLHKIVDLPFPSFSPDQLLEQEMSLAQYGIAGKVIPLPGHTKGSLAVVLESGEAFVGDLLRGGMVANQQAKLHFFHEDRSQAEQQIRRLLEMGVTNFYLGHWGPLSAEEVKKDYPFM